VTPLDEDVVRRTAARARIPVAEAELPRLTRDLAAMLERFARLEEIPVDGIEPFHHPLSLVDVLRPDDPRPGLAADTVRRSAPAADTAGFASPPVRRPGSP